MTPLQVFSSLMKGDKIKITEQELDKLKEHGVEVTVVGDEVMMTKKQIYFYSKHQPFKK